MPGRSANSSPPAAVRWVPCRAKCGSSGTPPGASRTNGMPWGWWCGPKAESRNGGKSWDKCDGKIWFWDVLGCFSMFWVCVSWVLVFFPVEYRVSFLDAMMMMMICRHWTFFAAETPRSYLLAEAWRKLQKQHAFVKSTKPSAEAQEFPVDAGDAVRLTWCLNSKDWSLISWRAGRLLWSKDAANTAAPNSTTLPKCGATTTAPRRSMMDFMGRMAQKICCCSLWTKDAAGGAKNGHTEDRFTPKPCCEKLLGKDLWMRWGEMRLKASESLWPRRGVWALALFEFPGHDLSTGRESYSSCLESLICLHGVGAASSCWHVWVQGRGRPVPWNWVLGSQSILILRTLRNCPTNNQKQSKSQETPSVCTGFRRHFALSPAEHHECLTDTQSLKNMQKLKNYLKKLPSLALSGAIFALGVALDRLLRPGGGWACDGGTKCTASWYQKWWKGRGTGGFNGNVLVSLFILLVIISSFLFKQRFKSTWIDTLRMVGWKCSGWISVGIIRKSSSQARQPQAAVAFGFGGCPVNRGSDSNGGTRGGCGCWATATPRSQHDPGYALVVTGSPGSWQWNGFMAPRHHSSGNLQMPQPWHRELGCGPLQEHSWNSVIWIGEMPTSSS